MSCDNSRLLQALLLLIGGTTPIDPPTDIAAGWTCRTDAAGAATQVDLPGSACHAVNAWWSRSIEIAPGTDDTIALALGAPTGTASVRINGTDDGMVSDDGKLLIVRVPEQAAQNGHIEIEVHVVATSDLLAALPWVAPFGEGPFLIGRSANVAALAKERARYDELSRTAMSAALSAMFLLVALYHVLVWLMRKSLDGYLWFGVFAFVANLWLTIVAFTGTSLLPLPLEQTAVLSNFVGALTNAAFIEFMFRFLAHKRPPRHWAAYQTVLVVVSGLGLVPHVGLALTVSPVVIVLKTAVPLLGLVEIVRFIRRGSRDATVLLVGIVIGALGAPLEVYVESRGIPLPISPGQAAFAAWMITMAAALARQFARTLDDVDARNLELSDTNRAIQRFVPFAFLELLKKKHVREVNRGDSARTVMSVMFCDLRGFTTLAEKLGPEETFSFINRYLAQMEPRIHAAGGFINQYLGDGIMALFPQADGAVDAAVGMCRALDGINMERASEPPLRIGVGIHTGALMLGTIGGGDQLDSGVVGDCVNTAARLEGITKMYGATVLISGETMNALTRRERFALRPLDFVRAKGKTEPLALVEVLDADAKDQRARKVESRGRFEAALALYRKGAFADAATAFRALADADATDAAVAAFAARCAEMVAAPPVSWDGVLSLTTK